MFLDGIMGMSLASSTVSRANYLVCSVLLSRPRRPPFLIDYQGGQGARLSFEESGGVDGHRGGRCT